MLQLVLSNIPIEGWIINLYVYDLLDGSDKVVWFPNYNGEIVQTGLMTCYVSMGINGGRAPETFLKSLAKSPCKIRNVFLITLTLSHLCL